MYLPLRDISPALLLNIKRNWVFEPVSEVNFINQYSFSNIGSSSKE